MRFGGLVFCVVEGKRLGSSKVGKVGSSEAPSAALFNFPLARLHLLHLLTTSSNLLAGPYTWSKYSDARSMTQPIAYTWQPISGRDR